MTIGERMRSRRKQLGFSAEYIAEKLGCSPATIYRYENGYIEKMPIDSVSPIASILGVTPAYLMGWEDEFGAEKPPPVKATVFPHWRKGLCSWCIVSRTIRRRCCWRR